MIDLVSKRYWYFLISALVLVPGVIFLALFGLPLSIDFTSGSLLEIAFEAGSRPQPGEVKELLSEYGLDEVAVQTSSDPATGSEFLVIRTVPIDAQKKNEIEAAIEERFAPITDELRFESVGARVSMETTRRALYAVGLASIAILLYICWAFRHVPNPVRFGTCATLSTIHDVFVVVGVFAILGRLRGWEMDALFLTALLTVIGFSVHDTIVVFDRIRENMKRRAGEPIESIVNHSIIQTIDRSLNTELGVLFTLTALLLFGGVTIRGLALTLLIGIISATYCSIFNASPLLVEWERRPERLLYALSFILPPLGGVMGGYLLLQGDRRTKGWAKGCLIGAGAGALFITLLISLKLTLI